MGALGAAYLAQEKLKMNSETETRFRGLHLAETQFKAKSFECTGCANRCEVVEIQQEGLALARWGDRCGKWANALGKGIYRAKPPEEQQGA